LPRDFPFRREEAQQGFFSVGMIHNTIGPGTLIFYVI